MSDFIVPEDKILEVEPDDIYVPERQRKASSRKFIESELAPSIAELGQLQPGICYEDPENGLTIIAGETRRRACKHLGIKFKYVLREDLTDPYSIKAAELYENLHRQNLTWQEEDRSIAELHMLRGEQHGKAVRGRRGGQTISKTAEELKFSSRKVERALEITPFLKLPEVANAKTRQEAQNKVKALINSLERKAALEEAKKDPQGAPTEEAISQATAAAQSGDGGEAEPTETRINMLAQYAERVKLGKFEEVVPTLPAEHFDIVIFDPPWGVDYDKVMFDSGAITKYSDSAEKFQEDFPQWIKEIFSKMAPNSHLYLFFGITWHQFVYDTLEAAGFETNRMPIFWHKRGTHRTRNPDVWPGRCYESIAYARKGSKSLQKKGAPDIVSTPPPSRSIKLSQPSAKHPDIIVDLLKRSALLGDKILDPMCGSGMTGVACEYLSDLQLDWTLIDKEEEFTNLALWNVGRGYYSIVGEEREDPATKMSQEEKARISAEQYERDHPVIEEPLPDDFKEIEVGTPLWKRYWKAHPEQQERMLKFKNLMESMDAEA